MNNVLEQFIGKECIIYTISNPSAVEGTITSSENGWITVKPFSSEGLNMVNCEYVTYIREYPRNKKGKRKAIFY